MNLANGRQNKFKATFEKYLPAYILAIPGITLGYISNSFVGTIDDRLFYAAATAGLALMAAASINMIRALAGSLSGKLSADAMVRVPIGQSARQKIAHF